MPGRSKRIGLGVAGGVAAEIEARRLREREHVVVERVAVGEVDGRARRDRQHVRHERLVALVHHGVAGFVCLERAARRGFQIDDRPQQVGDVARAAGVPRSDDRRPPLGRRRRAAQLDAAADGAVSRGSMRRRLPRSDTHGYQRHDGERPTCAVSRESPIVGRLTSDASEPEHQLRRDQVRDASTRPPSRVLC